MEFLQDIFSLLGRVCVSVMFLWASYEKIKHWGAHVSYMKSKGVPRVDIVLPTVLGVKIAGALAILLGWHAHLGALLLLVVTAATAIYLHPFWKASSSEKTLEKALFMKELAIAGGLFLILGLNFAHYGLSV